MADDLSAATPTCCRPRRPGAGPRRPHQHRPVVGRRRRSTTATTCTVGSLARRAPRATRRSTAPRRSGTSRAATSSGQSSPRDRPSGGSWRAPSRRSPSRADPAALPVSPCEAFDRGLTAAEQELFDQIARARLRPAAGTPASAYVDESVAAGQEVAYELRGVTAERQGTSRSRRREDPGGHFVLPDPPSGLTASGRRPPRARAVEPQPVRGHLRGPALHQSGRPVPQVNPKPVAYDMDSDLDEQPLSRRDPGFLDIRALGPRRPADEPPGRGLAGRRP